MSDLNLIRFSQLDPDVGPAVSGWVENGLSGFLNTYLLDGGPLGDVVYLIGNQGISGTKTFYSSPFVPYSGTSGQAVSKKYVDDTCLSTLSSNGTVFQTGNQTISGVKQFAGSYTAMKFVTVPGGTYGTSGINVENLSLVNGAGQKVLSWADLSFSGNWNFNNIPSISGSYYPILNYGDQSVYGNKSFLGNITVPDGYSYNSAVSYQQLTSAIAGVSTGVSSGFAGVTAFNGQSGYLFSQGRGTVTCRQDGNIFSVSGATPEQFSGFMQVSGVSVPTGVDLLRVAFPMNHSAVPHVFAELRCSGSNIIYPHLTSGIDISGFTALFSNTIASSGYYLSYLSLDVNAVLMGLKGEQGIPGAAFSTGTPPAVTGAPVAWANTLVYGVAYKIPLYQ